MITNVLPPFFMVHSVFAYSTGKLQSFVTIGWHDRLWTILNGKLTTGMLELLNIY